MSAPLRVTQNKDPALEHALATINASLEGVLEDPEARVTRPVVLVIGHQRSGTTLVSQLITSALRVGYPSNFVARFWRAPRVGIALQRAMLGAEAWSSSFTSELGTTSGLLEPHEFSYFWDRWFPDPANPARCADGAGFACAVANIEAGFGAPTAFKNVFNALRVEALAALLPTAVFVRVRRDLVDVAGSTLYARRHRYGTDRAWLGLRPAGCEAVADAPPVQQVAVQIAASEQRMAEGLRSLPAERRIDVAYRDVCTHPAGIIERLTTLGIERRAGAVTPASFSASRRAHGHEQAEALRRELSELLPADVIARGGRDIG
ncbi:sulfotransferase family protein [Haliangium sp.]|uniref:sulfotransferase family protein n=1 Tax=Haliangium sp. TaxID=2663208 RepID=UPI003D10299B